MQSKTLEFQSTDQTAMKPMRSFILTLLLLDIETHRIMFAIYNISNFVDAFTVNIHYLEIHVDMWIDALSRLRIRFYKKFRTAQS
jgi:hypothetical protein